MNFTALNLLKTRGPRSLRRRKILPRLWTPVELGTSLAAWYDPTYGVYTDGAANLVAASSEYLSRASNSTLQTGDVDWWASVWFYPATSTALGYITGKSDGTQTSEWDILFDTSSQPIFRHFRGDGSVSSAITMSAVTDGQWSHCLIYHDSVNDVIGISVNGGTFSTLSTTGVSDNPVVTTKAFGIGARSGPDLFFDGRVGQEFFGKSPVGGIAALATTIRNRLYNSGSGLFYQDLTAAEKTDWGLISAWLQNPADIAADTYPDSHGTNDLTENGTIDYAVGPTSRLVWADGQPVGTWRDKSGNGWHMTQATAASRPLYKTSVARGRAAVRFDGVDDVLTSSLPTSAVANVTIGVSISLLTTSEAGCVYLVGAPGNGYGLGVGSASFDEGAPGNDIIAAYEGVRWIDTNDSYGGTGFKRVMMTIQGSGFPEIYLDGASVYSDSIGAPAAPTTRAQIGAVVGSAVRFFNSHVCDIVLATSLLSPAELVALDSYLAHP